MGLMTTLQFGFYKRTSGGAKKETSKSEREREKEREEEEKEKKKEKEKEGNRLKRENEVQISNYDHIFSEWKVLIGSTDWKDHSTGKEGSEKYRLSNLPTSYFGPGVYELGLYQAQESNSKRRPQRKLTKADVVAVYVGQAENIRRRLQCYGRSGSHLEGVLDQSSSLDGIPLEKSSGSSWYQLNGLKEELDLTNDPNLKSVHGHQLFTETFSQGISIAFRWTAVGSKKEAEMLEAELLHKFDYAWNKGSNGERRPSDVFLKLKLQKNMKLHRKLYIKVALTLRKFTRQTPTPTPHSKRRENSKKYNPISMKDPVISPTKKAYALLNGSKMSSLQGKVSSDTSSDGGNGPILSLNGDQLLVCGVSMANGSLCMSLPEKGRRRCDLHKGLRLTSISPNSKNVDGARTRKKEHPLSCGAISENGSICTLAPVSGRKRCATHKGVRVSSKSYSPLI